MISLLRLFNFLINDKDITYKEWVLDDSIFKFRKNFVGPDLSIDDFYLLDVRKENNNIFLGRNSNFPFPLEILNDLDNLTDFEMILKYGRNITNEKILKNYNLSTDKNISIDTIHRFIERFLDV